MQTDGPGSPDQALPVPSGSGERMRRHRERRRRRVRWIGIELRETEIDGLIRRGLLALGDRDDRRAIVCAVHKFLDQSFARGDA